MLRFLALLSTLLLAACTADSMHMVFTPYNEYDFRAWQGNGNGVVSGTAFYRMPSGRVVSCAGAAITLLPANGYNLEASQVINMGGGFPENYSRSAFKFARSVLCDGGGHFAFDNLPTQNWIAYVHLSWQEPGIEFLGPDDRGGTLMQEVLVEPGEKRIVLSNPDFIPDR
jgi:hypothetical protein